MSESAGATLSPAAKAAAEAGVAAFAKGDFETARKRFRDLLQITPDNLTGLINLGSVEYRLHHLDDAEKLLRHAVHLDPNAALAWQTLGVVYNDQNRLDAALAALAQSIYLDPGNAHAHNFLAVVIEKKGWFDGAESELQRAIELDPDFAEAHFNLALAYLQRTPPAVELARRHYQKALDLGAAPDPLVEQQLAVAAPDSSP